MHATAVLSNLLVSSGAFLKGQIIEAPGLLHALLRHLRSAPSTHRLYACRLVLLLIRGEQYNAEKVGRFPDFIGAVMEAMDAGATIHHRACGTRFICIVMHMNVAARGLHEAGKGGQGLVADMIGSMSEGRIFRSVRALWAQDPDLRGRCMGLLRAISTAPENSFRIFHAVGIMAVVTTAAGNVEAEGTMQSDAAAVLMSIASVPETCVELGRVPEVLAATQALLGCTGQ
ncbi:hypothetical protein T484DRAFT_1777252, partial [Baffinella frigidus]